MGVILWNIKCFVPVFLVHRVAIQQFFFEIGMHCLGCPHSRGESIEDACYVHNTNADELVKKINDFLASKK